MTLAELNNVAEPMVAPGRGILAAVESSGTMSPRAPLRSASRTIGLKATADKRLDYRQDGHAQRCEIFEGKA
jgi:fructose-bisphosphate aldolase class I